MKDFFVMGLFLALASYAEAQVIGFEEAATVNYCLPSTIEFTNKSGSITGITEIEWDFGDGVVSRDTLNRYGVTHTYHSPGIYTVTLTARWGSTAPKTSSLQVEVFALPEFTISADKDTVCPGENVTFSVNLTSPSSPAGVASYLWVFGDGGFGSTFNPTYSYTNAGNTDLIPYDVELLIVDKNGCEHRETVDKLVYVRRKPDIDFSTDKDVFCLSSTTDAVVQFTNLTDNNLTPSGTNRNTYVWDFGDFTATSTDINPQHTYTSSAFFYVTLTATTPEGCTHSVRKSSSISVASFDIQGQYRLSDTVLCEVPSILTFQGTYPGASHHVTFGNGQEGHPGNGPYTTTYSKEGIYTIMIAAVHPNQLCRDTAWATIYVYEKIPAQNIITDTNMCDLTQAVQFNDATAYHQNVFRDFGLGNISWFFGDYFSPSGNYANGSTASHVYGNHGEYVAWQAVTTPYGCVLDTVIQRIHVFPLSTFAIFTEPDPMSGPPEGCVPLEICVSDFPDSLRTTSPITDYIWRWDYFREKDILGIDTTNTLTDIEACHTYPDTGIFFIYLTLINEQGCRYDVPVGRVRVGVPPVNDWTYEYMQDCKSVFSVKAMAYDSVIYDTTSLNPLRIDTLLIVSAGYEKYGVARANDWTWWDVQNPMAPIANGDTVSLSFSTEIGYQHAYLIPLHNGCAGDMVQKDSIGYLCPPMASIEEPEDPPEGILTFCGFEEISPLQIVNGTKGGMQYEWYMGDADMTQGMAAYMAAQTHFGPDTSTLHLRTWNTGEDSIVGGYVGLPLLFDYAPANDSIRFDTNFYTYKNGGVVIITLTAWNWDSTSMEYLDGVWNADSGRWEGTEPHPTYNRCKYCEDNAEKIFLISDAKMNFVADKYDMCQGDSVQIYDSTLCSVALARWGFGFLQAANPNSDYPLGRFIPMEENSNPPPNPFMLHFSLPNVYTLLLQDTCVFGCIRNDSLTINVWPRSTPAFTSAKAPTPPTLFNTQLDTLCFNKPDTLYLKDDTKKMAAPFDTIEIIDWTWNMENMEEITYKGQNVSTVPNGPGLTTVTLTVQNDKGCDSTIRFLDRVLINSVVPNFTYPIGTIPKTFCNGTNIAFTNRSRVFPALQNDYVTSITCTWNWGDNTPNTIQKHTSPPGGGPFPVVGHRYDFPDPVTRVPISLTVKIDGWDCEETYYDTLTIVRPVAKFTDDGHRFPCAGNTGRTIIFTDTSDGGPVYYTWNFGDGGDSSTVLGPDKSSVVYTYKYGGIYDVMLVVQDINQCTDTILKKEHVVIDGPVGHLEVDSLSGCTPWRLRLSPKINRDKNNAYTADTVYVNPDGAASVMRIGYQVENPVLHNYNFPGAYVPELRMIKWVNFEGQYLKCEIIRMLDDTVYAIDLEPDFPIDDLYCFNTPVEFERTTKVEPDYLLDSLHWVYGNGDEDWIYDAAGSLNGVASYDTDGVYLVALTEYHKLCNKRVSKLIEVMPEPELYFLPDTAIACQGVEVTFIADTIDDLLASRIARTSDNKLSIDWIFDDLTITGDTAKRDFTVSDTYNYTVLTTFTPKNCTKEWESSIVVFAYEAPVAEFSANPWEIGVGESIQFTDESEEKDLPIVRWEWKFGDKDSSNMQSPSHVYNVSGVLEVYLTIYDEYGCSDVKVHPVTIGEKINFPNIFTPVGGNGERLWFRPLEKKGFYDNLRLEVYDKWGMLVWKQECEAVKGCLDCCPKYDDDDFWWDGRNRQGKPVADGVYFWVLHAKNSTGTGYTIDNGSVTIFNNKK